RRHRVNSGYHHEVRGLWHCVPIDVRADGKAVVCGVVAIDPCNEGDAELAGLVVRADVMSPGSENARTRIPIVKEERQDWRYAWIWVLDEACPLPSRLVP